MIFNYFEQEKRLLYYEHGVDEIPDQVIAEFSSKGITHVDFSSNSLMSLDCLTHFPQLTEVIFDNNFLSDETVFPNKMFPNITLLSFNNNKFENIHQLVENIRHCFPNTRYLSLFGNKVCPALSQNYNDAEHQTYRNLIIDALPKLKFLDARPVERESSSLSKENEITVQSPTQHQERKMKKLETLRQSFGLSTTRRNDTENSQDYPNSRNIYSPLPDDNVEDSASKTSYGRVKSIYEGKSSQGNRFISNQDL